MNQPSIDVYSTIARDLVVDHVHNKMSERIGGPATFISAALKHQMVEFDLHVGPVIDVRIEVNEGGETGSVEAVQQNERVFTCTSDRAIVSILFREWDPQVIAGVCGEVYLDVQGFVRDPNAFGQKRMWNEFAGDWIKSLRCVKATEAELAFLPKESVEDQKTRLLLVTKGADGVDAYVDGQLLSFLPPRVVDSVDTIGAGDTFFAHVVARLLLGDAPRAAVVVALEETCGFLESKPTYQTR